MSHRTEVLEFRKLSAKFKQSDIETIVNKYLAMDRLQVQAAISQASTPMIEILIASIIAQAAQRGDSHRAEFIFALLRRSTLRADSSQ